MKELPSGLAAHLLRETTTLATAWRITRTDGVVLGFTDHDRVLEFDGTRFDPASGFTGTERPARAGGEAATAEVLGVITADAIRDTDIDMGRYDGARVETFRVNWQNPAERVLLSTARIGAIIREDGRFRAELRSPAAALKSPSGRVYAALCDAALGDARCGVSLAARRQNVTVGVVNDRNRLTLTGLSGAAPERFIWGEARWVSGARTGFLDRITGIETRAGLTIAGFQAAVGDFARAGDRLELTEGCDQRFLTCRDVFSNSANFRGFPHVPGTDFVLRLPKSGDVLDGTPLVG